MSGAFRSEPGPPDTQEPGGTIRVLGEGGLEAEGVRKAFYKCFLDDRSDGVNRTLRAYQALFPGWETLIAAEHAALEPGSVDMFFESTRSQGGLGPARCGLYGELPRSVGRYELRAVLGEGGMGVVYLARDPKLGRTVVVKTLKRHGHRSESTEALARLAHEARTGGRLDIEGICPVFDVVEADGLIHVVMPFIPGKSLAAVLDARIDDGSGKSLARLKTKDLAPALALMAKICDAVHKAHEAGVIHRDLKPGNIMIRPDGNPVIIDFGLAAGTAYDDGGAALAPSEEDGAVVGTPGYMAPEQVEGRVSVLDSRTDVYALGVTLYQLLTLARPFDGNARKETFDRILAGRYRPVREFLPRVSLDVGAVCAKAMEVRQADRYATAAALADDLRAVLDGRPTLARPCSLPARWAYALRKHRIAVSLVMALVCASIAFAIWLDRKDAGNRVEWLQAFTRYQDARFDQGGLSKADLDVLLEPFARTGDVGSIVRDPFARETYQRIRKYAADLPRSGVGGASSFLLRAPRGSVATDRPAFRFSPLRDPGEPITLVVTDLDRSTAAFRLPVAAYPGRVTVDVELPAGARLTPGSRYSWSLVSTAGGLPRTPASEFIVTTPSDREAVLARAPATPSPAINVLLRGGMLIASGYLADGCAELDRLPLGASDRERALAAMLRAEVACREGDEEQFNRLRDEAMVLAQGHGSHASSR